MKSIFKTHDTSVSEMPALTGGFGIARKNPRALSNYMNSAEEKMAMNSTIGCRQKKN